MTGGRRSDILPANAMSGRPPGSKSARLQELIHRTDRVLVVLHPPSAALARIMEQAGCEVAFVGTGDRKSVV